MRIQYKGGVWKNSEDEILKAAVMKYGKNQWARIASLLVRKSAKQCKARWYEWLDPSIKKTQWTREEEEKLLHLVKIMPTSWRTIAPMIGRTAAQCIEHYEKLLDRAARGATDTADGAGPSAAAAASKPRPGDIDAAPESKPARPDPVDMDEDELEMLSEARARLANTKGKKAKRKAREKQLEVAKRLAQLQKRRELKAAGVYLKPKRHNRKVTDYATEIPFERTPAPGFYDTREEDEKIAHEDAPKKQLGKLLQQYKGKSEEEREEEARKRDAQKRQELQQVNLPAALGLEKKAVGARSPPLKRARMSLPAPQVSDFQLEKIAKAGAAVRNQQAAAGASHISSDRRDDFSQATGKSGSLASSMSALEDNPNELWSTVRQRHLETIMNLKSAQTPLRGGVDTPVSLGLENGVTPLRNELRTPNPLATPFSESNESHPASNAYQEARKKAEKARRLREKLRSGFDALPEPENEYQIDFDDALLGENDENEAMNGSYVVDEDAEDEEKRNEARYKEGIEAEKERLLSSAAKRRLPIPDLRESSNPGEIERLVRTDMDSHRILRGLAKLEQNASTALQELRSLRKGEGNESPGILRARKLIEEEMIKSKHNGFDLEKHIFEQLKSSG